MNTDGHLTVRKIPKDLVNALREETKRRGTSLNQTVIDVLGQALGLRGEKSNGLEKFAGTWTEEEFAEFEKALAESRKIDSELWA